MTFFKNIFARRPTTRSRLSVEPCTPVSPVSSTVNDIDEDEIDYSPCIRQEAAGIRLQNKERLMIEEMNKTLIEWSVGQKKWVKKWRRSIQKKEAYYQPYTTTLDVFLAVITVLNGVAAQAEESSKKLNKILQDLPKSVEGWVKAEIDGANSKRKEVKDVLDALENEYKKVKADFNRIQTKLGKCRPNTEKYTNLQEQRESLKQQRKQLKEDVSEKRDKYRQAQEQHHTKMEAIYERSQKEESTRLENMLKPLINFVDAFGIKSTALDEAIQNHNPAADLASWKVKHFSS